MKRKTRKKAKSRATTKARKPAKKAKSARKAPKARKTKKASSGKSKTAKTKSHWADYKTMQGKIDKAWLKLRSHVKNKASPSTLLEDKNELLLLLGECNYMARECMRCAKKERM